MTMTLDPGHETVDLSPARLRSSEVTHAFPVFRPASCPVPSLSSPSSTQVLEFELEPERAVEPERVKPFMCRGFHRRGTDHPVAAYLMAAVGLALFAASSGFITAVLVLP
jgi:hypothetical protein